MCAWSVPWIKSSIPLCWIWSDYSQLLEITLISNNLQTFLKFVHLLRVRGSIFWTVLLFRWRYERFRIGVILTLSFLKRRSFFLLLFPFALARESVRLSTFELFFRFVSKWVIITLRSLIDSCWTRSISYCSFCTLAWSSNLLATIGVWP